MASSKRAFAGWAFAGWARAGAAFRGVVGGGPTPSGDVNVLDFSDPCEPGLARVGDAGTKVVVRVTKNDGLPADVSTGTVSIKMKRGFDPTKTYAGTFVTDGTDGRAYFLTDADTFDAPGVWQVQAVATVGAATWSDPPATFTVEGPNL